MSDRIVIADTKRALYFGWARAGHGHVLYDDRLSCIYDRERDAPGLPWDDALLDTGLLRNGKHLDVCDGRVWWTCGGRPLWLAFFWWDRSGDRRANSCSNFCVAGFGHKEPQAAFDYACAAFPMIVERQRMPLVLQP